MGWPKLATPEAHSPLLKRRVNPFDVILLDYRLPDSGDLRVAL